MSFAVSVSEVRNALRCPRIFTLGRAQRRTVGFPVSSSSFGAVFHRLVAAFAASANTPPPALAALGELADEEAVASTIAGVLLDAAAAEIERAPRYATMPIELDDLAEALRELARYLAREIKLAGGPPAAALTRLFADSQLELEHRIDLDDGGAVLLTGCVDALQTPGTGAFSLLEYKLAPEANEALDRAQVALYRLLLRGSRAVQAEPALLRFQPQLTVTRLAPEEADALVQERLLPLVQQLADWSGDGTHAPGPEQPDLCATCPVRAACAVTYPSYLPSRDQPPANAARPLTDAKGETLLAPASSKPTASRVDDQPGRDEAEELRSAVGQSYQDLGVAVRIGEVKVGPRLVSVEVRAQRSSIREVDRSSQEVVQRLEAERGARASYLRGGGLRRLEVARRTSRPVLLNALLERAEAYLRARSGRFVVGEDVEGHELCGDFAEPASCHLLVSGGSGSGKSVLLRTLLASLAHYHGPEAIRFTLIDPKRAAFAPFKSSLAAHLAHPLCFEVGEALAILEGLVSEMEERYQIFEAAGAEDLDGYNESVEPVQRIARHVIVVDEYAELISTRAGREAFLSTLQRLCAKARAAGLHLVLATERADTKSVPGLIKTNLVGRIALQLPDATASRIVLGQLGAEKLLGKGDLYADFGAGPKRAQAAVLGTPA